MNIRTVLLLSFAALLSSLGLTVLAAPPGGHLNISQVLVDDPNDPTSITIVGTDFLFGPEAPIVTLGEYVDPLEIVGVPTNETIVALLPENIVAGDYLLTVATGTGQSQNDEYDLTLGAVGPPDTGERPLYNLPVQTIRLIALKTPMMARETAPCPKPKLYVR